MKTKSYKTVFDKNTEFCYISCYEKTYCYIIDLQIC